MGTWVQEEDIINRWGKGVDRPGNGNPQLIAFIEDAESILEDRIPSLEEKIATGKIKESTIKRVLSNAIIRALKIGQNYYSNFSNTTGPFSQSGSIASGTPRSLTLTDDELAEIDPESFSATGGIGSLTVNPHGGYYGAWLNPTRPHRRI